MEIYGSDIRGGVLHEGGSLNGWKLPTQWVHSSSGFWLFWLISRVLADFKHRSRQNFRFFSFFKFSNFQFSNFRSFCLFVHLVTPYLTVWILIIEWPRPRAEYEVETETFNKTTAENFFLVEKEARSCQHPISNLLTLQRACKRTECRLLLVCLSISAHFVTPALLLRVLRYSCVAQGACAGPVVACASISDSI